MNEYGSVVGIEPWSRISRPVARWVKKLLSAMRASADDEARDGEAEPTTPAMLGQRDGGAGARPLADAPTVPVAPTGAESAWRLVARRRRGSGVS